MSAPAIVMSPNAETTKMQGSDRYPVSRLECVPA